MVLADCCATVDKGTSPQHRIARAGTTFQGSVFIQPLTFEEDYWFRVLTNLLSLDSLRSRDRDLRPCSAGFLCCHECFLNCGEARYLGLTVSPNSNCPHVHELDPKDKDIGSNIQQGAMSFLESTTHVIKILYVFSIKS